MQRHHHGHYIQACLRKGSVYCPSSAQAVKSKTKNHGEVEKVEPRCQPQQKKSPGELGHSFPSAFSAEGGDDPEDEQILARWTTVAGGSDKGGRTTQPYGIKGMNIHKEGTSLTPI